MPTRAQRIVQSVEDPAHARGVIRNAMVAYRLADVLDAQRQLRIVASELAGMREINETVDARAQQASQALARSLRCRSAGVLSREQLARQHPVAVT